MGFHTMCSDQHFSLQQGGSAQLTVIVQRRRCQLVVISGLIIPTYLQKFSTDDMVSTVAQAAVIFASFFADFPVFSGVALLTFHDNSDRKDKENSFSG